MLAYDHRVGEWAPRRVEKFHESIYEGPLLTVHTDSGSVRTTVYHPFWVQSGRDLQERSTPRELAEDEDEGLSLPGRWVNSHELRCGDVLVGQDGQRRVVLKIEQEFVSGFLVHNLTIREDHTFAVGADGVLVHNTDGCGPPKIRNQHLAGQSHPKTGVPFDENGFPDFSNYATHTVNIKQKGNYTTDFTEANKLAGLKETPEGYTWHHQDGTTMQLVLTDIHRATGHTGGVGLR